MTEFITNNPLISTILIFLTIFAASNVVVYKIINGMEHYVDNDDLQWVHIWSVSIALVSVAIIKFFTII